MAAEHAEGGKAVIEMCNFSYVRYNAGRQALMPVQQMLKASMDRQQPVMIQGKIQERKPGERQSVIFTDENLAVYSSYQCALSVL